MRTLESLIKKFGGWSKVFKPYPAVDYSDNFDAIYDFLNNSDYNLDKEIEDFFSEEKIKKLLNAIQDALDFMYSSYEDAVITGVPVPKCVLVQILTNALSDKRKDGSFLDTRTCKQRKASFFDAFNDFIKKSQGLRATTLYNFCIKSLPLRFVYDDFVENAFWHDLQKACKKNYVLPIYQYNLFKRAHPEFNDELEYFEKNIEMPYNKITMSKF